MVGSIHNRIAAFEHLAETSKTHNGVMHIAPNPTTGFSAVKAQDSSVTSKETFAAAATSNPFTPTKAASAAPGNPFNPTKAASAAPGNPFNPTKAASATPGQQNSGEMIDTLELKKAKISGDTKENKNEIEHRDDNIFDSLLEEPKNPTHGNNKNFNESNMTTDPFCDLQQDEPPKSMQQILEEEDKKLNLDESPVQIITVASRGEASSNTDEEDKTNEIMDNRDDISVSPLSFLGHKIDARRETQEQFSPMFGAIDEATESGQSGPSNSEIGDSHQTKKPIMNPVNDEIDDFFSSFDFDSPAPLLDNRASSEKQPNLENETTNEIVKNENVEQENEEDDVSLSEYFDNLLTENSSSNLVEKEQQKDQSIAEPLSKNDISKPNPGDPERTAFGPQIPPDNQNFNKQGFAAFNDLLPQTMDTMNPTNDEAIVGEDEFEKVPNFQTNVNNAITLAKPTGESPISQGELKDITADQTNIHNGTNVVNATNPFNLEEVPTYQANFSMQKNEVSGIAKPPNIQKNLNDGINEVKAEVQVNSEERPTTHAAHEEMAPEFHTKEAKATDQLEEITTAQATFHDDKNNAKATVEEISPSLVNLDENANQVIPVGQKIIAETPNGTDELKTVGQLKFEEVPVTQKKLNDDEVKVVGLNDSEEKPIIQANFIGDMNGANASSRMAPPNNNESTNMANPISSQVGVNFSPMEQNTNINAANASSQVNVKQAPFIQPILTSEEKTSSQINVDQTMIAQANFNVDANKMQSAKEVNAEEAPNVQSNFNHLWGNGTDLNPVSPLNNNAKSEDVNKAVDKSVPKPILNDNDVDANKMQSAQEVNAEEAPNVQSNFNHFWGNGTDLNPVSPLNNNVKSEDVNKAVDKSVSKQILDDNDNHGINAVQTIENLASDMAKMSLLPLQTTDESEQRDIKANPSDTIDYDSLPDRIDMDDYLPEFHGKYDSQRIRVIKTIEFPTRMKKITTENQNSTVGSSMQHRGSPYNMYSDIAQDLEINATATMSFDNTLPNHHQISKTPGVNTNDTDDISDTSPFAAIGDEDSLQGVEEANFVNNSTQSAGPSSTNYKNTEQHLSYLFSTNPNQVQGEDLANQNYNDPFMHLDNAQSFFMEGPEQSQFEQNARKNNQSNQQNLFQYNPSLEHSPHKQSQQPQSGPPLTYKNANAFMPTDDSDSLGVSVLTEDTAQKRNNQEESSMMTYSVSEKSHKSTSISGGGQKPKKRPSSMAQDPSKPVPIFRTASALHNNPALHNAHSTISDLTGMDTVSVPSAQRRPSINGNANNSQTLSTINGPVPNPAEQKENRGRSRGLSPFRRRRDTSLDSSFTNGSRSSFKQPSVTHSEKTPYTDNTHVKDKPKRGFSLRSLSPWRRRNAQKKEENKFERPDSSGSYSRPSIKHSPSQILADDERIEGSIPLVAVNPSQDSAEEKKPIRRFSLRSFSPFSRRGRNKSASRSKSRGVSSRRSVGRRSSSRQLGRRKQSKADPFYEDDSL